MNEELHDDEVEQTYDDPYVDPRSDPSGNPAVGVHAATTRGSERAPKPKRGHTPGPWVVEAAEGVPDELEIVAVHDRFQLASAWGGMDRDDDTNPTMHANARLMAAAPELLDGCKAALGAFERNDAIDWSILERAIAKAEGR